MYFRPELLQCAPQIVLCFRKKFSLRDSRERILVQTGLPHRKKRHHTKARPYSYTPVPEDYVAQSALDLNVWKEIAIAKQILIKTATDTLGLDPECNDDELKVELEKAMQQIKDADSQVTKANAINAGIVADIRDKLEATQKILKDVEAKNKSLEDQNAALINQVEVNRLQSLKDIEKTATQLEEKNRALKAINTALADTPENVVKKMKQLNKKKFDESTARKSAEAIAKTLKKEKQDLEKNVKGLEADKELASKLADQHRELHTFSNEQYTELKELSKDEESLKSVPELDETVLKPFTTETEEDES